MKMIENSSWTGIENKASLVKRVKNNLAELDERSLQTHGILPFLAVTVILMLVFLKSNAQGAGQDTAYFSSTLKMLVSMKEVKSALVNQKKYLNGKIKSQELLVAYKNDSLGRYWQVGRSYRYYKDGKIMSYVNIDLKHGVLVDTAFDYYSNGKVSRMMIWENDSNYTSVEAKSQFSIEWQKFPMKYRIVQFDKQGNKKSDIACRVVEGTTVIDDPDADKEGMLDSKVASAGKGNLSN